MSSEKITNQLNGKEIKMSEVIDFAVFNTKVNTNGMKYFTVEQMTAANDIVDIVGGFDLDKYNTQIYACVEVLTLGTAMYVPVTVKVA